MGAKNKEQRIKTCPWSLLFAPYFIIYAYVPAKVVKLVSKLFEVLAFARMTRRFFNNGGDPDFRQDPKCIKVLTFTMNLK